MNGPGAVDVRSANAQLSPFPFHPGGPVQCSQGSLDKFLGHSCQGGCLWAPHVTQRIPVSKSHCFLGT